MRLEVPNLSIERCDILTDYICQFGDLDRSIVEQCLSLGHCIWARVSRLHNDGTSNEREVHDYDRDDRGIRVK